MFKIFKRQNTFGRMAVRDRFEEIKRLIHNEEPNIIDGGAHSGEMTDKFLKLFNKPTLHLFEPIPLLAENLKEKYKNYNNLYVHKNALGSTNQKIFFNVLNYQGSSSILNPTKVNHDYHPGMMDVAQKIEVEQVRLDNIVFDDIDIVKLDIQGYELEALKGMEKLLPKIKLITTEIEFIPLYENQPLFADIDIFIRENGFKLLNLYELWTHPDGQLTSGDAIYLNENYF